jgi:AraC-like DNA-binding protein
METTRTTSRLIVHDGDDQLAMWICRFPADEPGGWGVHHHRQHQIAWVSEGMATTSVGSRSWVLPPTRALFIPAGVPHDTVHRLPSVLHCLYAWPAACPLEWTEPTVIAVSPLVRELMLAMTGPGLHTEVADSARTLFFGLVERLTDPGTEIGLPVDPRARAVAEHLVGQPADDRSLDEWAAAFSSSASTLRRAFLTGTGMTFTDWRTQVRLRASLPLVADGVPIAAVARRVGYTSLNGYVDAFRRHYGHTPAAHFRATSGQVAQ